jgi:PAS domain S-box-containing protein
MEREDANRELIDRLEELEKEVDSLRAIVASTQDHVLMQDSNLRYVHVINPQIGLTEQEMMGKTDHEILAKKDADRLTRIKRRVIETARPLTVKTSLVNGKGQREFFEGSYVPRFDQDGKVDGLIGYFQNVTARRRTQENLKRSERRFRSLFSSMTEGVCEHRIVYDSDGKAIDYVIENANSAYESITGLTTGDIKGKMASVIYGSRPPPYIDIYARVAATQEPFSFETYHAPMGKHFAISVFSASRGGFVTVFSDVTDRRKADEAVRLSEQNYRRIVETSAEGIVIGALDGTILFANKRMSDMLGYPLEELVGQMGTKFMDRTQAAVVKDSREILETGSNIQQEYLFRRKDGSLLVTLCSAAPILDADGQHTANLGMHSDITNRKLTEDALRESERRFIKVFYSSPAAMAISSLPLGRYTEVNDAFVRLTGYSREELIGRTSVEVGLFPTNPADREETLQNVLHSGRSSSRELAIRARNGQTMTVLSATERFSFLGNDSAVSIIVDITERKKAEEIKDDFIGMVSHELKTPLTVMMGAVNTAMSDSIAPAERRALLGDVEWAAEAMSDIVDNLLELSRWQANRLVLSRSSTDVGSIVMTVVSRLAPMSSTHRMIADIADDLPSVNVDHSRIERVLDNLISNAVKYSPDGGEVRISARQDDDHVLVSVSDQGIGISAADQMKLFQPFERLDNAPLKTAVQGVGLGLIVCRRLVEAHGGRVWVESREGKGSVFYFTLPIV